MMEQDSPWKEVVEDLFEDFLAFFFPHVHKEIDFSKGHQFRIDVISLALLTDDNPKFHPSVYRRARLGCEVIFRYPIVKVIDYRDRWAELEANPHPFAIIVKAYLRTLETEGNVQERYTWKKRFLLELYQRGMKRETLLAIYKFVDWIMEVPKELEKEILEEIKTTEETKAMPHITTAERIGMEKGIAQGIAQGIATIIEIKFGESGQPLLERTKRMRDAETLQKLMGKLKYVQSLSEAEKIFNDMEVQSSGLGD